MAGMFLNDILANPVAFLSSNAANMTGAVKLEPGAAGKFTGKVSPTFKVRYRTGSKFLGMGNAKADGEAWELRWKKPGEGNFGADTQEFDAIWSGYAGGLATHCDLPGGGAAALMLTPRVDGCTLTFSVGAGGSARFGHYNLVQADGKSTLTGAGMATAARANYGDQDPAVFSKEFYYAKAKRDTPGFGRRTIVNAVGVRSKGAWRFFVQYLEAKGDGYQIRGVDELQAGAKYIAAVLG